MSLRAKLLLVALSILALPWAGWQFVQRMDSPGASVVSGQVTVAMRSAVPTRSTRNAISRRSC